LSEFKKFQQEILSSKDAFEVVNACCPKCGGILKNVEVLEKYPRSYGVVFPYKTKLHSKLVKASGCIGKHVFLVHFKRVKKEDYGSSNIGFEVTKVEEQKIE